MNALMPPRKPEMLPEAVMPYREQLAIAHDELYRYRLALDTLGRNPGFACVVLRIEKGRAAVLDSTGAIVVPEIPSTLGEVRVGDLLLSNDKAQISRRLELPPWGPVGTVKRILPEGEGSVEVDDAKGPHVVIAPAHLNVRLRDRVVLDPIRGNVIVRNLGRVDDAFAYSDDTHVTWDDIGGQADAKRALIEAIEEPARFGDVYKKYKKKETRGILLAGPPGCGKTLLGKAAATAVARLHGKKTGGFIMVKGPELLDKFVGESEANIRRIFATARAHKEAHGVPAVVFLDEADALLAKRGAARALEGMERTIVPMFLSEMDGMGESGALVIMATNRPDMLDSAIVRPGRVDRKIVVERPSRADAAEIALRALEGKPTATTGLHEYIAASVFSDMPANALFMVRMTKGGEDRRFLLKELASGALVVDVVERATQRAIRRAISGLGSDTGIEHRDVEESVQEIVREEKEVDHEADLASFCEPFKRLEPRWEKA